MFENYRKKGNTEIKEIFT